MHFRSDVGINGKGGSGVLESLYRSYWQEASIAALLHAGDRTELDSRALASHWKAARPDCSNHRLPAWVGARTGVAEGIRDRAFLFFVR